jgi:hypothetical protein
MRQLSDCRKQEAVNAEVVVGRRVADRYCKRSKLPMVSLKLRGSRGCARSLGDEEDGGIQS